MFEKKRWSLILVTVVLFTLSSCPLWAQGSLYFFAHVVDGATGGNFFTTQFLFNNPSSNPINVTMTFTLANGSAWALDFRGFDVPFGFVSGVASFTLAPKQTAHFFTGGVNPLAVGWCKVNTNAPLEVSEVFDFVNKNGASFRVISEAGVLPGPLSTQFTFDADVSSGNPVGGNLTNTGLAIANPSSATANVTATLTNGPGAQVSQKTVNVAGLSQTALFLNQLFTDALPPSKSAENATITGTFHGTVRLSSNVNIAVLVLRDNITSAGDLFSSVAVNSDSTLNYNVSYDIEPNDTFATAQPITLPARIIGTMITPGDSADVDFFSVSLIAGQTLSVFAVADFLGSPLDDVIILFDPTHTQVAINDNISIGLKDPFVSFTAPTTGTYFIEHGSTGGNNTRLSHYELLVRARF